MLASDIITLPVRTELNDTGATPRWTDPELVRALDAAVKKLWDKRPDALYVDDAIVVTAPAEITALTAAVPVLDKFKPALVCYVLYRAFMRDSDDAANLKRAEVYLQQFAMEIA